MNDSLWNYERRFMGALQTLEGNGLSISESLCRREIQAGKNRLLEIADAVGGSNLSSPKVLAKLLLDDLGLPIVKRSRLTGNPSFDKDAMEEYEPMLEARDNPIGNLILEHRGWTKAIPTYYEAFLRNRGHCGKVHPNLHLHRAVTTRLASSKPNFQNIPRASSKPWNKSTKKAIVPEQGYQLVEIDYSNVELRLAADYCDELELLEAFNSGVKIWPVIQERTGWDKEPTKTFVYSTLYGAQEKRIMNVFNKTWLEAREMRNDFFGHYPGFRSFPNKIEEYAKQHMQIPLWTGRIRHFQFESECRKAFNSLLQGGAAEIVKRALIRVSEEVCNNLIRLVLTVHDSLVLEIHESLDVDGVTQQVSDIMCDVKGDFSVKFAVESKVWGSE